MTILPGDTVMVDRVSHPCAEELRGHVHVVTAIGNACWFMCPRCGAQAVIKDTPAFTDGKSGDALPLSWLRKFDVTVDVSRGTSVREVV